MKRKYFKYRFGYINIDEENLYVTNSGNWHEAHETKEISRKKLAGRRYIGIYSYIIKYTFYIIGFALVTSSKDRIIVYGGTISLYGIYLAISQFINTDNNEKYRIPLAKITAVTEVKPGWIKIDFINGQGVPDTETIECPQEEGPALLLNVVK